MTLSIERYENKIYAALRIVAGFLFFWHGLDKVFGVFGLNQGEPAYIAYTAGTIELIAGPLILLGLFTRVAAFLSSGLMACAYWIALAPANILPYLNHGDTAILYCFVFLYIAAKGSGIWSIDALLNRKDGV